MTKVATHALAFTIADPFSSHTDSTVILISEMVRNVWVSVDRLDLDDILYKSELTIQKFETESKI